MAVSKKERASYGLTASEARYVGKISVEDVALIMLKLSETILLQHTFTNEAMSLDIDGASCDVFSDKATKRDLLGWILKFSYEHWSELRSGRKSIGHMMSMYIDSHIRTTSNNTLRLLSLGDKGATFASQYLIQAIATLNTQSLPPLFKYAMEFESEEDKQKRLEKAAKRKAKILAKTDKPSDKTKPV